MVLNCLQHCPQRPLATAVAVFLLVAMFYYNIFKLVQPYSGSPTELNITTRTFLRKQIQQFNDTEEFLINTPGCVIPNYMKSLSFNETKFINSTCYERVVFVERSSEYEHNEITFRIDYHKVLKQKEQSFKCAYRFALRSNVRGKEDNGLIYTDFKPFENGDTVKLEEEVIEVLCNLTISGSSKLERISTYSDAYLVLKMKQIESAESPLGEQYELALERWSVLLLGMDTMSRARAHRSLPSVVRYLQENHWLDYRGYNKVAENTFPNIMAILSGKNASSARSDCSPGMDQCEYSLIWNQFKKAGYMTAFGEDNLKLPDTFAIGRGFAAPPTDHYARPLLLLGEYPRGNLVCARSRPSAQHLLDYALQFAQAYKNSSYFGHFWINSHSHNIVSLPSLFETDLINFFESLKNGGNLDNTFVFFLSDHGIRFGPQRTPRESYYEERLPMLFVWAPAAFRETHPAAFSQLQLNQFRLTTPYDLHATLLDLLARSGGGAGGGGGLGAPVPLARGCAAARVDAKWCACHGLTPAPAHDAAAKRSLELAVQYVQLRANSTKTVRCTVCSPMHLDEVLRNDWYESGGARYYVVAFRMRPGAAAFEATVRAGGAGGVGALVPPTTAISSYNARGSCTLNKFHKPFCVCQKIKNCS